MRVSLYNLQQTSMVISLLLLNFWHYYCVLVCIPQPTEENKHLPYWNLNLTSKTNFAFERTLQKETIIKFQLSFNMSHFVFPRTLENRFAIYNKFCTCLTLQCTINFNTHFIPDTESLILLHHALLCIQQLS